MLLQHAPDLKENDIVVTSSGVTGPDLTLSPAALERFPFVVEVKNQEAINIWAALKQAADHPGEGTKLLCFTRNGAEMYAALKLEDLLKLVPKKDEYKLRMSEKVFDRIWSPKAEVPFDWE